MIALLTLEAFPLVFLRQDNDTFTPTPTSADALKRSKRFLVYVPNGGILKFVTGDTRKVLIRLNEQFFE